MAATFTAFAKFKAVDKMSRPFKQMARGAKSFANKTEIAFARVERRIRKVTQRLGKFGLLLGAGLLIGVVSNVTRTFTGFEQANANLSSVMANATQPELQALQKNAKALGATTAKSATEVVGLQEAFARLGFAGDDIIKMTGATIAGSIAMRGELADTAELVGAMVKSFDDLTEAMAPDIVDQMTRATQQSALNFEKLQTGLPIVAGAANALKIPFNETLALMGKLSDAGLDASMSATSLRNIFLESAKKGVPYRKLLDKVLNSTDQLKTANELFGKRGAVAAVILSKTAKETEKLTKNLLIGAGAEEAAAKQLDTLTGATTLLKSAWEGFILSVEDGNGKIGEFLKTTVKVATEILNMASGTEKARGELSKAELKIRKLAERGMALLKVLKVLLITFVGFKIVIGIMKAWAAAQWLLNAAMSASPITWIILAIAALALGVRALIVNWQEIVSWVKTSDNFFAKLIRGALIPIIFLFNMIKKAWMSIKAAFKGGGILEGLKQIGRSILSFMLLPLEAILKVTSKLTKGRIGGQALAAISNFRDDLNSAPGDKITTTKVTSMKESIAREERITKQQATLNINNNTDFDVSTDAPKAFPIKLSTTNGQ